MAERDSVRPNVTGTDTGAWSPALAGSLQPAAADPRGANHVRVSAEDQTAREVGGVVVLDAGHRRDVGRVHGDQVGLLARFERSGLVAQAERLRPAERPEP